jgi:hypothetical protein
MLPRIIVLLVALPILAAAACAVVDVSPEPSSASSTIPFTPPSGETYFPHHNIGPDDPGPTALVEGRLERFGRCIVLHSEPDGTVYLPLWPTAFKLADNGLSISTGAGDIVRLNTSITFAGGEFDVRRQATVVSRLMGGQLPPSDCALELVWVVTERLDSP